MNLKYFVQMAGLLAALLLLGGCGGGGGSNPSGGGLPGTSGSPATSLPSGTTLMWITVTSSVPGSLPKGLTQQFKATGYYLSGATQDITASVTWSSTTTTVATVSATGLATGVGAGATNIIAAMGSVSSFSSLTVVPAVVQSIAITPANPSVTAGLSTQLTATGTFSDGTTQDITATAFWSSSNGAVARISAPGLALGVSAGSATISASSGTITSSTKLTVANYVVGGTVTSLPVGASVVLQNNGTDNLTLTANGSFVFNTSLATSATYNVTVLTQPAAPAHPCTVVNGSGTITNAYITSVQVVCGAVVTTFAGGKYGSANGIGTAASFSSPRGVAIDATGNLYVGDKGNQLIRKITPAGLVSTLAGTVGVFGYADGTGTAAIFDNPDGVAVDTAGNVYVADNWNSVIRKITPAGVVTTFAGAVQTGMTVLSFMAPTGIAVDATGTAYVADNIGVIRKVTPAGVVSIWAGSTTLVGAVNGTGTAATFSSPTAAVVDTAGNVYVADTGNHLIRKITSAGVVSTLAGTAGVTGSANGTGTLATFNSPQGIAVDTAGNIYVADTGNGLIRLITPAGVVTTLAGCRSLSCSPYGDGPALLATFFGPIGLAVDATGNVYVADAAAIRKITP